MHIKCILSGTILSCVSHSSKAPQYLAWNSNIFPRRILLVLTYTSSFILAVQVGEEGRGEEELWELSIICSNLSSGTVTVK